ncbi:hypothetical protein CYMTET_7968 [Cymbomonas tetramitiformis]|uniref:Uncharacterized protein n=1 Tax=Cymbomonas tetramitiformis TaxID=36881 RepID=A0AAE0GTY5_9CHLO|nr:hypothetical protein CYMTET_9817 [Cymbomonas tetramitiformis]KAK3284379.1 hypothetical protein CYMTET_7968 [Cymbomonas tetramitiformis]
MHSWLSSNYARFNEAATAIQGCYRGYRARQKLVHQLSGELNDTYVGQRSEADWGVLSHSSLATKGQVSKSTPALEAQQARASHTNSFVTRYLEREAKEQGRKSISRTPAYS